MTEYGKFPVAECLIAATRTNAELMKWSDKVGTIEAGKLADVVAFDESPFDNIEIMNHCSFVMKDGVVYKG